MDAELAELYSAIQDLQVTSMNCMAVTALLVYEIALTSGKEIKYIWRTPWSLVNVLYVIIRYYSLGYLLINAYQSVNTNLSVQFCSHYNPYVIWGGIIFVPIADLLLMLRIYALYHQSKKMAIFVVALWITELVATFTIIGLQFAPTDIAMADPLPGILPGCFSTVNPSATMVIRSGATVTVFQAAYLSLTLYKLMARVKAFGFSLTPLLTVFFRDGTGYCLIFFAMYLFVTLLFALGSESLQGVAQLWMVVIISITSGRLVLNLRDVANTPDNSLIIKPSEPSHSASTRRTALSSSSGLDDRGSRPWWGAEGYRVEPFSSARGTTPAV